MTLKLFLLDIDKLSSAQSRSSHLNLTKKEKKKKKEKQMGEAEVRILSTHTIKPSPPRATKGDKEEEKLPKRTIHLNPWDLSPMSFNYMQKGLLFKKPPNFTISPLLTSFSQCLSHFYPLAGRFSTTTHPSSSISISLDCTDDGATFAHASAPHVSVSDILSPDNHLVPPFVHSFFPLNGLLNYDGHSHPLLAVQVTEMSDGVFIAVSLTHSVADGSSFWHFVNAWSKICRTGDASIDSPPLFDRWFPDSCPVPIPLPFKDHTEFVRRPPRPSTVFRECALSFSSESIKKLKRRANAEVARDDISSLQALLAHAWRSISRARRLRADQDTTHVLYAGYRSRMDPPLPQAFFGNSFMPVRITASAAEILSGGLGWTASLLNRAVAEQGAGRAVEWARAWAESPSVAHAGQFKGTDVATGSSPRFDVYGNDFGWGRPVAVRSGPWGKVDGKMTVYQGPEEGSMGLEICLKEEVLSALLGDGEFMHAVN